MKEVWKDVKGYEGLYRVSNLGRVKSYRKQIPYLLTQYKTPRGYIYVSLYKQKESKNKRVHRLVAQAFIPNPNNLPDVNHKDENKSNNCVNNLEWCDRKYNNNYGTRTLRASVKQQVPLYLININHNVQKCCGIEQAEKITGASQNTIRNCLKHITECFHDWIFLSVREYQETILDNDLDEYVDMVFRNNNDYHRQVFQSKYVY